MQAMRRKNAGFGKNLQKGAQKPNKLGKFARPLYSRREMRYNKKDNSKYGRLSDHEYH